MSPLCNHINRLLSQHFSTCKQLTKTLGSKRPAVDWLIVVYCSSVNFVTISTTMSLYSISCRILFADGSKLKDLCPPTVIGAVITMTMIGSRMVARYAAKLAPSCSQDCRQLMSPMPPWEWARYNLSGEALRWWLWYLLKTFHMSTSRSLTFLLVHFTVTNGYLNRDMARLASTLCLEFSWDYHILWSLFLYSAITLSFTFLSSMANSCSTPRYRWVSLSDKHLICTGTTCQQLKHHPHLHLPQ